MFMQNGGHLEKKGAIFDFQMATKYKELFQ